MNQSAFGVEHEVSKAIRIPKPMSMDAKVAGEKMKTMTGHLKRANELGAKPKGK